MSLFEYTFDCNCGVCEYGCEKTVLLLKKDGKTESYEVNHNRKTISFIDEIKGKVTNDIINNKKINYSKYKNYEIE